MRYTLYQLIEGQWLRVSHVTFESLYRAELYFTDDLFIGETVGWPPLAVKELVPGPTFRLSREYGEVEQSTV